MRLRGFKVHELSAFVNVPAVHGRRDFYKLGVVTGEMTIAYGGQVVEIQDTVLFFVNPRVSRSVPAAQGDHGLCLYIYGSF